MPEERVQKILARAGYGSRRANEELIIAGRVMINGKPAILGSKADPSRDTIIVDNQQLAKQEAPVYIAINKPQGVLSDVSPEENRQTVRDLVPVPGHLFIVGRLDMDSEGLILLTNDGELTNQLTHPRYGHEKEYQVLVGARPDDRQLEAWRHGIVLEDGHKTIPAEVRVEGIAGKGAWMRVVLREGRKRQIREMGKQTGLPVFRIIRIRIGSLALGDLKPGAWRALRPEEVRALKVNKSVREGSSATDRPRRRVPRQNIQREQHGPASAGRPGGSAGTGRPAGTGGRSTQISRKSPGGKPFGGRTGSGRPSAGTDKPGRRESSRGPRKRG